MNSLGLLLPRAITPGMTEALTTTLRADGWQVQALRPPGQAVEPSRLLPAHDLYLLLSSSPLALAMAGALTARGAAILNPHAGVLRARDTIVRTAVLAAAALPVPPTWTTGQAQTLAPLWDEGPLQITPHTAAVGAGDAEIGGPMMAAAYAEVRDRYGLPLPLVASRPVTGAGRRFRLEVVDGTVLPSLVRGPAIAGELAVAAVTALDLFVAGVDFAETGGRLVITGVDPIPRIDGGASLGAALAGLVRRHAGRLAPPIPAAGAGR